MKKQPNFFIRLWKNNIFRLSVLYSALFLLASIVMLSVAYGIMERNIRSSIEREVNAEITRFIGSYQSTQLGIQNEPYAFFIEQRGRQLAGNIKEFSTLLDSSEAVPPLLNISADQVALDPETKTKGTIIGKKITLSDQTRLFIGKNNYDATERQRDILDAFSSALLALLIFGAIGGLVVSFQSIRRIDTISKVSKSIMAGQLDLRVPLTKSNDDLEDLARNMNNMLDRINDLMQGMRQVSNNIAHDLRTPLTRLRANIETISRKSEGDIHIEAEKALEETDQLLNTFASLLRISQVESGAVEIPQETINLSQLVTEIMDFYEALAEEKSQIVNLHIADNIMVCGDRSLLSQAIVNIFTNAVKYTPDRGRILIELNQINSKAAQLVIHDSGSGVPEEYLSKLTQRFYRLEEHRNTANGNGLGLSMVKAIVDAHHGSLAFTNDIGLKVSLTLPLLNITQITTTNPIKQ